MTGFLCKKSSDLELLVRHFPSIKDSSFSLHSKILLPFQTPLQQMQKYLALGAVLQYSVSCVQPTHCILTHKSAVGLANTPMTANDEIVDVLFSRATR